MSSNSLFREEKDILDNKSRRPKKRYEINAKGENVLQYYGTVSGLIENEPNPRYYLFFPTSTHGTLDHIASR